MEGKLNKKLLLLIVKYGSWTIGLAYFIQVVLGCFGMQSVILTYLFSASFIPIITLLAFSFFLGFCIWHRLPMYYTLVADTINAIDFYIGIPIYGKWMLVIYILLAGLCVLIGCFIKNKQHVKERNFKETPTNNSR